MDKLIEHNYIWGFFIWGRLEGAKGFLMRSRKKPVWVKIDWLDLQVVAISRMV